MTRRRAATTTSPARLSYPTVMNRLTRGLLHSVTLVFLTCLFISCNGNDVEQPIAYNHQIHVEAAGLGCTDCHVTAETAPHASIPSTEICSSCHADEPIGESPEEAKLLRYIADGTEVPWAKVYAVPDHVYFSHRRHIVGGELECGDCHGDVATFTTAVSRPFLPTTMENCMDCHRDRNVTNDCLSCHR